MCLYDYLVKFWSVGASCKSVGLGRSSFLPAPGQDKPAWSWEAGGSCWATLSSECFCEHCDRLSPLVMERMYGKQTDPVSTYKRLCQPQTFPLLQLMGMPAPLKNTNTRAEKKSLPYSTLGRAQPLTFTWANKRNILTLPSWNAVHTEVTSICLIWIQVTHINLCIKTIAKSKPKGFPFSRAHSNGFTANAAFQNAI